MIDAAWLARPHSAPALLHEIDDPQSTTLQRFEVDAVFGSWRQAQRIHFDDGGVFDRIYVR